MNIVCQVCGATMRDDAKFCSKCGVPLSLLAQAGSHLIDSQSEITIVAASHADGLARNDDDEVPTVDAPARPRPVVAPPVLNAPAVNQTTLASPATKPHVNYPPAATSPNVATPVAGSQRPRHILLSKPAWTILFVFIFASLPLFIPKLSAMLSSEGQTYRQMLPDPHELITFKKSSASDSVIPGGDEASGEASAEATSSPTGVDQPVQVENKNQIKDPTNSLNAFYAALARTDAKQAGAITRITHYGDSPITNDGLTAPVRRLLQEQFGDAGHGFILMNKPWDWYGHKAITFSSGGGWD